MIAALLVFIIPLTETSTIQLVTKLTKNIKIGAICTTILLFLLPSVFLGLIPPIILKLKLKDLENAGKTSGKLSAIATIGGILGTITGGFFLIPNFGSVHILYILVIILAWIIPLIDLKIKDKFNIAIILITIINILFINFSMVKNNYMADAILSGEMNKKTSIDTQYGRVIIYNSKFKGENVRFLNIDSGFESATFTDEDKVNELVFEYTKYYNLMFKSNNDINDVLLIGGAGYSYPKYFISHFENKKMDVVEIDGKITEVAKKYFYLDKLIKDYDLENSKRLNLITEDGRTYLNNNTKKYDAILNDAFSGDSPAKTLTTIETVKNIKKSLNPNGVYLTNIISALEGENTKFLKAEYNTLKEVFKNVYVVPCGEAESPTTIINNMVMATDDDLDIDIKYDFQVSDDEIILTDDYCPVDTLCDYK